MIDFDKLLQGERRYTFHSHTQFCDGHATMEEMAAAAVAADFRHYGFSPHSPIPFASPCNMRAADTAEYIERAGEIRRRYAGRCNFLTGMEVDYIDADWGPSSAYFRNLALDFTIGSVHFIPDFEGEPVDIDGKFENFRRKMTDRFRSDIDYVVDTFYRQSQAMLAAGGFDIMGHFDKVGQNAAYYAPGIEDGCHYRACVDALIDSIISSGVTVELNTKAYVAHGRMFPGERYLPRLAAAGVPFVVNSDAHDPARIDASRAEGFAMLDRLCR